MKKFFIDSILKEDGSVLIEEFKQLPSELLNKEVELLPEMGICSILDTETTGLDHYNDEIIEIAVRKWLYHRTEHYLIKPLEEYSALNEPVRNEISTLITELTGITKEDVQGQKIDWEIVSKMLGESDFIMAHNAGFDRPMMEAVPQIKDISASKIWTCSFKQVGWSAKGFLSGKQELLSVFHGFHYSGHRALTDIDALSNILLKGDYLKEILANAKTKQVKIDCVKAPFDSKDTLKANGFFWDAPNKFWSTLVSEKELDSMKAFLEDSVYPPGKMGAKFTTIELKDRFKK
jgi:DNA polymerase-3 subunit epsilon